VSGTRTETWRVESEEGEINEVTLTYEHYYWQGDYKGTLGDVAGWPRAAAAKVAAKCHMSVVSILAPGEPTRAEAIAAERERLAAMLRNHGDDRVNDAPEYAEAIYDAESLVRGERPVYAPPKPAPQPIVWGSMPTPEAVAKHAAGREQDGAPWMLRHAGKSGVRVDVLYLRCDRGKVCYRDAHGPAWWLVQGLMLTSKWRPITDDGGVAT